MYRIWRWLFPCAIYLCLIACGSQEPIASTGAVELVGSTNLPNPTAGDYRLEDRRYLMGPLDKINVDVFGVGELSREIQVDSSGRFDFPLIGTIDVNGRTPKMVANEIERKLEAAYVRDPNVTINLLETVSQRVTVDGEVTTPGMYPITADMTLLRAIAVAEGVSEFASVDDVVIFRTVGGKRYAALYNLGAIRRGNYEDPPVYANDVVVVGESRARRLFDNVFRAAPLITTPVLILLRS